MMPPVTWRQRILRQVFPRRGGRRDAVECACQPPRKLHLTPKQIEGGPVICSVCNAPFQAPDDSDQAGAEED